MKRLSAVVLAAGRGARFQYEVPKPLVKINSKPVIIYSLEALSRHRYIKDIIVVANKENLAGITQQIKKYKLGKVRRIVLGGRLRQDSVWAGLAALDSGTDLVLIHDAARPFISKKQVSMLADEACASGAAILGVPVKATIKEVEARSSSLGLVRLRSPQVARDKKFEVRPSAWFDFAHHKSLGTRSSKFKAKYVVEKTLDRQRLWEIQTPQVFKKELILEAYKRFRHIAVTDDSALVEKLGAKVSVVLGSYENIKITTREDLAIAEAIASKQEMTRFQDTITKQ